MRKSREMQKVITAMAKRRELDLAEIGTHFKVQSSSFMDLVVEAIGDNQVSVAHYYEQNGDLCQDPEVVFYIAPDSEWYAIEWTTPAFRLNGKVWGGYERVVWFDDDEPTRYKYKPRAQRDLAIFANKWAKNIRMQGFK